MSDSPDGLGGLFQMEGLMKMAQDLQKRLQDAQSENEALTATASAGGGMATATVNGQHRVLSLRFEPDLLAGEDLEVLQDLAVAAVNMAMEKVDQKLQERMGQITGQLPISLPGLGL